MKKQNIDNAINRLAKMIPNGTLMAETIPADFLDAVADRIDVLEEFARIQYRIHGHELREYSDGLEFEKTLYR
ncbi:hypothetical protein EOL73_00280 [Candidatus Saccharibacteria bacterium]|nr:hypothetical protein [Candidatus Saccharibacteria bacterium]